LLGRLLPVKHKNAVLSAADPVQGDFPAAAARDEIIPLTPIKKMLRHLSERDALAWIPIAWWWALRRAFLVAVRPFLGPVGVGPLDGLFAERKALDGFGAGRLVNHVQGLPGDRTRIDQVLEHRIIPRSEERVRQEIVEVSCGCSPLRCLPDRGQRYT